MFWAWRRSRLTDTAVAFFNAINNNNGSGNGGHAAGASKKSSQGYNKLSCLEECATADQANGNAVDLNQTNTSPPLSNNHGQGADTSDSSSSDFDLEEDDFSDDSEYDEALTCNVCDRSFSSPRQLARHQQKKRHFGCSACDSLFQSLMALEHHKEEFEHWSGDENMLPLPRHPASDDSSEETSELERLL